MKITVSTLGNLNNEHFPFHSLFYKPKLPLPCQFWLLRTVSSESKKEKLLVERGILKELLEVWWQCETDSASVPVLGCFEYIYESPPPSPPPPPNLGSTIFAFFWTSFSVKMLQIQTWDSQMALSLFNDQPSRKGKVN